MIKTNKMIRLTENAAKADYKSMFSEWSNHLFLMEHITNAMTTTEKLSNAKTEAGQRSIENAKNEIYMPVFFISIKLHHRNIYNHCIIKKQTKEHYRKKSEE